MADKLPIILEVDDKASKALDKVSDEITGLEKTVKKTGATLKRVFETAAGVTIGIVFTKALEKATQAASRLFSTLVVDGIRAAQGHEDAITALSIALARNGEFSQAALKDLENFSNELERLTAIDADVILSLNALALSFGFTAEQSKVATKAAIELSVAAGLSVEEALRRVGRTISGSIADVSKFAQGINDLTREELAAGKAAEVLERELRGTAEAVAQTFTGSINGATLSFGKLQEEIGTIITQNPVIISSIKEVSKAFTALAKFVEDNRVEIQLFVAEGLVFFIEALGPTTEAILNFANTGSEAFFKLKKTIEDWRLELANVVAFINDDTNAAFLILQEQAANTALAFEPLIQDSAIDKITMKLNEMGEAARANFEKFKAETAKGEKAVTSIVNREQKARTGLTRKELNLRLTAVSQTLGNVASLQAIGGKTAFAIGKGAAIAQAGINTVQGVSNALAGPPTGPPFPFNIALAISQGIALAAKVSQLGSAKPPSFQQGITRIPEGFDNDNFLIQTQTGEGVIDRGTNERLKAFLDTGGTVNLALEVQVQGETIFKAVQEQLNSGRVLVTA